MKLNFQMQKEPTDQRQESAKTNSAKAWIYSNANAIQSGIIRIK